MLCKQCRHCGLCPGDGTVAVQKNASILQEELLSADIVQDIRNAKRISLSQNPQEIGIAIDIGTTTIVAVVYSLHTAQKLASVSEINAQMGFGTDIIARISYSEASGGYETLRACLVLQLKRLIMRLVSDVSFFFQSERRGRAAVKRLVFCGNTTLLCFLCAKPVAPLARFPFEVPDFFGRAVLAQDLLQLSKNQHDTPLDFLLRDCEAYIPPVISAFVGGDTVAALLSFMHTPVKAPVRYRFLADIGTNCEMAVVDTKTGAVVCTSSSAGPAFEAQGIECGMPAREGAICKVEPCDPLGGCCWRPTVIGGGTAQGICGTGVLSAAAAFYKTGVINAHGTFLHDTQRVFVTQTVYVSQKDMRNVQLAKAAVCSGLNVLKGSVSFAQEPWCGENAELFLCGGFGAKLNTDDALCIGMIPRDLGTIVAAGNMALSGAVLLLLSFDLRAEAKEIARTAKHIQLAEKSGFQEQYIGALEFPEV